MSKSVTQNSQKGIDVNATEAQQLALRRLKAERNFISFPFFALSNHDAHQRRKSEIHISFAQNGNVYQGRAEILTAEGFIYPTPFDKRVHKAIEYLITQHGFPVQNPFYFSSYEVLKLLNLNPKSGTNIEQIRVSCERISATRIRARRLVYNKNKGAVERGDVFGIFDYSYVRQNEKEAGDEQLNWIKLSDWYADNLNNNYVKPLDFEYFRSLDNDIAGRLYELVGLGFYGIFLNRSKQDWTQSYVRYAYHDLCQQLPTVPQRYLSDAKKSFERAHIVLTKTGFFKRVVWETSRNSWSIKYFPGSRAIDEYEQYRVLASNEVVEQLDLPISLPGAKEVGESPKNAPEARFEAPTGPSARDKATQRDKATHLAQMLIERGIRPRPAGELAKKFPSRIRLHIEVFDFMMSKPENGIRDPQGYLRKSIEENWFVDPNSLPSGFVSRQEQEEKRRQKEQARQDLLAEFQQAEAKVKAEVGDWAELAPEQRISVKLDFWETEYRRRHRANPTDEERQKRKEVYLRDLPTPEQKLANRLNELRRQFEQKAVEQGIGDINFHAAGPA